MHHNGHFGPIHRASKELMTRYVSVVTTLSFFLIISTNAAFATPTTTYSFDLQELIVDAYSVDSQGNATRVFYGQGGQPVQAPSITNRSDSPVWDLHSTVSDFTYYTDPEHSSTLGHGTATSDIWFTNAVVQANGNSQSIVFGPGAGTVNMTNAPLGSNLLTVNTSPMSFLPDNPIPYQAEIGVATNGAEGHGFLLDSNYFSNIYNTPTTFHAWFTAAVGNMFYHIDAHYYNGHCIGQCSADNGTPVPEPSTWALVASSLLGLTLTMRRRMHQQML